MASKNLERIYLYDFLKNTPALSIVDDRDEQESPDFILRDEIGLLGLEVTQIFKDSPSAGFSAKETESHRQKFLRKLASRYYGLGGMPVSVKANLGEVPTENVIAQAADNLISKRPRDPYQMQSVAVEGAGTYHITALPMEMTNYSRWQCINNMIGWVANLDVEQLEARIKAKKEKLDIYRRGVKRVGLLLVVDRTRESGMLEWSPNAISPSPMGFDALFLHIHPVQSFRLV